MKVLGNTMSGHSQYADRLWALLCGYADVDPYDPMSDPVFSGIDHVGLIPYMLLAGASVETQHVPCDDWMVSLSIAIPDGFEDEFYRRVEGLLAKARDSAQ